jgi:hypothetical protein
MNGDEELRRTIPFLEAVRALQEDRWCPEDLPGRFTGLEDALYCLICDALNESGPVCEVEGGGVGLLRKAVGLSVDQVGALIGIPRSAVIDLEDRPVTSKWTWEYAQVLLAGLFCLIERLVR